MQKILVTFTLISFVMAAFGCNENEYHNRMGRETAAIATLGAIARFEEEFKSSEGRYGTLRDLAEKGLINRAVTDGKPIYHYVFSDSKVTATTYCIHATRENSDSGFRDFNVDESNTIRMAPTSKTIVTLIKGEGAPISKVLE